MNRRCCQIWMSWYLHGSCGVNSAKCALASHIMLFISLPLTPLPKSEYNGFLKMTDIHDVTVCGTLRNLYPSIDVIAEYRLDLLIFVVNGDVSIWEKNFLSGTKNNFIQTNLNYFWIKMPLIYFICVHIARWIWECSSIV